MDKAKVISFGDYDGFFFSRYCNDTVVTKEEFEEGYLDTFDADKSLKRVFATTSYQSFDLDIYDIISERAEGGYEDMYSNLDTDSPLLKQTQELLNQWMKENHETLKSYIEDNLLVVDLAELYEEGMNNDKENIQQSKCNHRNEKGTPQLDYDSTYEMRGTEMHCTLCGKEGTRDELWNEGIKDGEIL